MNLSRPFIVRPVMTTLLMLAVIVIGIFAYQAIPISNLPDVDFPTISVTANLPGASPTVMANTVATPLEKVFMAIPGIKYVTSSNTLGNTNISLTFDIDKNVDLAAVDVQSAIASARGNLPPDLPQEPIFKKVNPSATPILFIAVTSPSLTMGEIYDYANTLIGQRISIIEGVAQVQVLGSPKAVRVQVDPGFLASMGLTSDEIAQAVASGNQYLPLGQIDGTTKAQLIYDNGSLKTAAEYKDLIVTYRNGSPVRLEEVATLVDSIRSDRSMRSYIKGDLEQPSVTLAVQRQPGANTIQVADAVNALLSELNKQLPGSLELITVFDRSESIRNSVWNVKRTLLEAFLLVILIIYLYLGKVRDTIIPSLVMPLSVIGTIAIIYYKGYTLDNLSLLALTLAIGFIIDDAIVVIENIVRNIEEGKTPQEAALEGSRQISFTIVSMTLSLLAVFIPLLFMSGIIGKLFQEFAVTLAIVTLLSGIISLTLTPMLCARFLPPRQQADSGRMVFWSHKFNSWLLGHYKKMLSWVLNHRLFILSVGIICVFLSAYLFKILPNDFIPDEDIGFLIGYTESEQGTSSDQMNAYQNLVLDVLKNEPDIKSLVSISASPVYRQGLVFITLNPNETRKPILELSQMYSEKLSRIPGINVYIKNVPLIDLNIGTQARGAYQYLMQSLNSENLYKSAENLFEKMRLDPIFQGISTDLEIKTPQLNLEINRDLASTLGLDARSIEQALLLGYSGNRVSRIQTALDQYDVIVELNRDLQRTPDSLESVYLKSQTTNELVPLSAVVRPYENVGPASINHFAQFPAVTITFNLAPGIALSDGLAHLRELADTSFTPDVIGNVKGTAETFEETLSSIGFLLLATIFSIYIILGILYESFIHPITILSTLPPAIVGALITLYFTGYPLSLYAYLGIILLIGIVKKNGIIVIDFALENIRNKGETAEKSIYDACIIRFRPIMMTTLTTIMGAIPIALASGSGAVSLRPLGFVIIGGMCISQLITLFLTPVIYLYFEELREKFTGTVNGS